MGLAVQLVCVCVKVPVFAHACTDPLVELLSHPHTLVEGKEKWLFVNWFRRFDECHSQSLESMIKITEGKIYLVYMFLL